MFRKSLHNILRSTPQRLFSAFQHMRSTGNARSIAVNPRLANATRAETVPNALSGKHDTLQSLNAPSIDSAESTLYHDCSHDWYL